MTKKERDTLLEAIVALEANPMEWEEAMHRLYSLAGHEYRDLRKIAGDSVRLFDLLNAKRQEGGDGE